MEKYITFKNVVDDGVTVTVTTTFVKNNRYYIKLYNNMKKKGLKWPKTMVSTWTHSEEKELFGI